MIEYTYEQKTKLATKIGRIKTKSELIEIKKIINNNNPSLELVKNNNGYFVEFHNLNENTYSELAKYIEKIEALNNLKNTTVSELESSNSDKYEKSENFSDSISQKKLKYTNSETHILNRVKYEKELKKHQHEEANEIIHNTNIFKKMKK
jgi:hypothetical protein